MLRLTLQFVESQQTGEKDDEETESEWDNSSSVAGEDFGEDGDDVMVVDAAMMEAMDKSYDEDGNEIDYDSEAEGEEDENEDDDSAAVEERKADEEDDEKSNSSSVVASVKTEDMSICTFLKHTDFVGCISFHPLNPDVFISGGGDDIARMWDISSAEKPTMETPKQNETIDFAKFSFDGKFFATGALDGSVKIWDGVTGEFKRTLEGPADEIRVSSHVAHKSHSLNMSGVYLDSSQTGTARVT